MASNKALFALLTLAASIAEVQAMNPQPPQIVSVRQDTGQPAYAYCGGLRFDPAARFLGFACDGLLVPGDTNNRADTFLLDRTTGVIDLVSRSSTGQQTMYGSGLGVPSSDGTEVVFLGTGPLHPDYGPPPMLEVGRAAIYLRHLETGVTDLLSRDVHGASLIWYLSFYDARPSSHEILFNYDRDIRIPRPALPGYGYNLWIKNWETGSAELVSRQPDGSLSGGGAFNASFSTTGRHVLFSGSGDDLGPKARDGDNNIYLRDRLTGTIERLTYPSAGGEFQSAPLRFSIGPGKPTMSADLRYVVFSSNSNELHPATATTGGTHVYLLDRQTSQLHHLSETPDYISVNSYADMSEDGRYVAWLSRNALLNTPPNPPASMRAIRVLDRQTGQRVDITTSIGPLRGDTGISLDLSADGSMIAFTWRVADPSDPQYGLEPVYTVDLRGGQPYAEPQRVPIGGRGGVLIAVLLAWMGVHVTRRRGHGAHYRRTA